MLKRALGYAGKKNRETQITTFRHIEKQAGFVVVDFRGCGSSEFYQTYQDFGALCARREVRGALLRTGDEQPEAHYTLRDILWTVARVGGISVRFKVALVAPSDAIAHVYWIIRHELRTLGCDARLFRAEEEAERWLRGKESPARPASARVALV